MTCGNSRMQNEKMWEMVSAVSKMGNGMSVRENMSRWKYLFPSAAAGAGDGQWSLSGHGH